MSEKFPMTLRVRRHEGAPQAAEGCRTPAEQQGDRDRAGHGDLSENADYSAAKEEQGLIEAKIREPRSEIGHGRGY